MTTDDTPAPPVSRITTVSREVLGPVTTDADLAQALDRLGGGSGPVAVDAERASGYRYSQRAYLLQLARSGSPVVLIDPVAFTTLAPVQRALGGEEWIVHAASQDLACLREVGMQPQRIFDTEVAGRLLGLDWVSLNSMLELFLQVSLEKGHSAADWSTRPLPADWLLYAALDVDLLVQLRDAVAQELDRVGKREWAEQEFAAALRATPPGPRVDPWRRTSGIHALHSRRQLAAVRALWESRDEMATARDIAPGRVLPDAAIVAAVRSDPRDVEALSRLRVFRGPRQRTHAGRWFGALEVARSLPESGLPSTVGRIDGMPASGRWRERNPVAAARLGAVRTVVNELADVHEVQAQTLLPADIVRRLCWQAPEPVSTETVAAALTRLGARPWQVGLCAEPITAALRAAAGPPDGPPDGRPDGSPDGPPDGRPEGSPDGRSNGAPPAG